MPDRNPPPGYTDLADAERAERPPAADPPPAGTDSGPCPVTPMGHRGLVYYFLTTSGELVSLRKAELNRIGIKALFGGDLAWIKAKFPAYDREGHPKPGSWSDDSASTWLIQACTRRGLFDADLPQRSIGIWRSRGGQLVVHIGNEVLLGDTWRAPGFEHDQALYLAPPPVTPPAATPATTTDVRTLTEAIRRWTYAETIGPDLILGFIGAALYGGTPLWRIHALLLGKRGAGKSWLCDLVPAALGAGAYNANNITEAGLRQVMTNRAQAVVLDEQESDTIGAVRVEHVVGLPRLQRLGLRVRRGCRGGP